ncbi:MAG: fimbrillin family protein [Prevotella sp.]|nr:fimbrillin family protein [Prevotella sp.]MBR6087228.1 fimbrillin family protein [Prevotella sp.]
MKYYLAVLGLTFVLAACSDADDTSGSSDMAQLTIDVTETGWHGETVSVDTRSGETLEELKAAYPARNWNLSSIPDADITALVAATSLWTHDGDTYTSATAFNNTLRGGDGGTTELSYTADLIFSAASGNIHIVNNVNNETDNCISFTGVLTIPNLKAGQTVTIVLKSPSGETRTMQASNVSGSPVVTATTEKTTETRTVANTGSVTFTAAADINIYSISVSKAEDEGFGIYCHELSLTNTQVTWDNVNSRWQIGSDYNTYWRRNQSGTLNIYAYAPYKATPYTVTDDGKLTYEAGRHNYPSFSTLLSGGNVDLLYASKKNYARNSTEAAVLEFKHALAKMTFGTITNNTGGTLSINGFTIHGHDKLYQSATLNLVTGEWSNHVDYAAGSIQSPPPFASIVIPPLADKETIIPTMPSRELSFIPGPDGTLPLTIDVNTNSSEKFSFNITLQQGKNYTYNISVGKNFEVVITE